MSLVRERAARHAITLTVDVGSETSRPSTPTSSGSSRSSSTWLSNAVKFTPDGGCGRTSGPTTWTDELVVTVTDTGVGIPPEDRERIFESFQQGGRGVAREEGTGLGLTLSRRIVELFDGRLWLESEVGVGSTFGFAMPARPRAVADRHPGRVHPTVLLVDDDRASLDLVTAYLEELRPAPRAGARRRGGAALARRGAPGGGRPRHPPARRSTAGRCSSGCGRTRETSNVPVVVVSVVDERARGLEEGARST